MRDDERPTIRVMMGKPSPTVSRWPKQIIVCDLLDIYKYTQDGFGLIGIDPESEQEWMAWRERHPEAS